MAGLDLWAPVILSSIPTHKRHKHTRSIQIHFTSNGRASVHTTTGREDMDTHTFAHLCLLYLTEQREGYA